MKLLPASLAAITLLIASPVTAETLSTKSDVCSAVNVKSMTPEQIDAVKVLCPPENSTPKPKITPNDVRDWASLGSEFATAVTDTARGLGMAANEFLFTPLGILIAFYFLWDFFGGIIIGFALLALVWFSYFKLTRDLERDCQEEIEYEYKPVFFGLFNRKVVKSSIWKSDRWGDQRLGGPAGVMGIKIAVFLGAIFITGIITSSLIF